MWKFLDYPPVITSQERIEELKEWAEACGLIHFQAHTIENLIAGEMASSWHLSKPHDLAFLFFTSGSTGTPKAVMLTHDNLLSMVLGMVQKLEFTEKDITFNWMPLDHAAAITMMHLRDLYLCNRQIIAPTSAILLDPLKWIDAMDHYRATLSWAPNFAFALVCDYPEEIAMRPWDLSSMRFLINAGETVVAKIGRRFLQLLEPKGLNPHAMCPMWGMSETSSGVVISQGFSRAVVRDEDAFVDLGSPIAGFSLRIVDDLNHVLPEGHVGRLQVKGPSLTKGYWGQPELNERLFSQDGWFDTGDQGFLKGGSLTLTGRSSDVIIINGINFYSHQIEAAVEELSEVKTSYTAACAVREKEGATDQIAIFFATASELDDLQMDQLLKKIRSHVSTSIGATATYLIPMQAHAIPKTTIGKIQRSHLKKAFEKGEFDEKIHRPSMDAIPPSYLNNASEGAASEEIQKQLLHFLRVELKVEGSIEPSSTLHSLGINSIMMMKLIRELEKRYHISITSRELFLHPSLKTLAQYVASRGGEEEKREQKNQQDLDKLATSNALSEVQKGIWALQKISPTLTAYHIPLCLSFSSGLDIEKLQRAFRDTLEEHPILKAAVREVEGEPSLQMASSEQLTLQMENISPLQESELIPYMKRKVKEPFHLEKALLRAQLLNCSANQQFLLLTLHHMIFDGLSSLTFLETLLGKYRFYLEGKEPPPLEMQSSYAHFVLWEKEMLADGRGAAHAAYWKKQLSGASYTLQLPYYLSKSSPSHEGEVYTRALPRALVERIRKFGQEHGKSLSTLFLGAYLILLHRYSSQEDILVGMPVMVRPEQRFDKAIGLFLNMIPIRSQAKLDLPFLDFIHHVQLTVLDGLDHASYPFSRIVGDSSSLGHRLGSSLLQAAFFYQNFFHSTSYREIFSQHKDLFSVDLVREIHQEGEYPLVFELWEEDNDCTLNVKYNADLFDSEMVESMASQYFNLLEAMLANPSLPIGKYSLITRQERDELLVNWNATEKPYPNLPVHELFEQQARATPDARAVVCGQHVLTYRELNERATILARHLHALGVGPNLAVGICLERSLDMVVGLLAILKAQGAYVPMDPSYPEKQLQYILESSKAKIVITHSGFNKKFDSATKESLHMLFLDDGWEKSMQERSDSPLAQATLSDLAYLIYTSGSTGKPKGVMISHKGLTNFLYSMAQRPGLTSKDRLLAITTYNFDISTLEIFLPLIMGAECLLCKEGVVKDPDKLKAEIGRLKPTVMQATPATWNMLFRSGWKNEERLKILCGGEALSEDLKRYFIDSQSEAWNLFGPTETTVWSTVSEIRKERPITIGQPIANTQVYILDKQLEPVGVAIPGELYIGGEGVARGYWNDPELTEKKFIDSPFKAKTKLFKTGDSARFLKNGQIEYLGRLDHQVKIRGFRIELGAIDSRMRELPWIVESVTVVKEDFENKKLVTYYVAHQSVSSQELRAKLQTHLPDYMVPAHLIRLEELPLTPNGKIDRKELENRAITMKEAGGFSSNLIEQRLLSLWQEILHVEGIGIETGFFDVGGNSLLAVKLVEKIKSTFSCPFSITDLFTYPSIRSMSTYLNEIKEVNHLSETSPCEVRTSGSQAGSPHGELEESIAIIGISCQFPGAKNHYQFYKMLLEGDEAVKFFTKEELSELGVDRDLTENANFVPLKPALEGRELFDPEFFHLSPKDAEMMDPQLRLLLQHAWKAVEDAGYVSKNIPDTSVYMSASQNGYKALLDEQGLEGSDSYIAWALAQSGSIPTVISYKLGLKGPSYYVHANCSSSLVGLSAAFQSLKSGESQYALVGATTLHIPPIMGYAHQQGLNFSSDGHIRAFDAKADGMIAGEGVAVILLKRTAEAVKDRDHIYAIVRGVAINNDGADKAGFYAPSVKGQSAVIKRALQTCSVDPCTIRFVEAHGTGTAIGDPIEIAALSEAFSTAGCKRQTCAIGSVKSNIGHLDTAAGLAGCIKVAMSLRYGEIPPSINYQKPNPQLSLERSPFYVAEKRELLEKGGIHRAALSAFGIGGTNVHAIFEQCSGERLSGTQRPPYLIPLSARNEERLIEYAKELLAFLHSPEWDDSAIGDLAYTLQVGREAMASRLVFVSTGADQFKAHLEAYVKGNLSAGCFKGKVTGDLLLESELAMSLVLQGKFDRLAELWSQGFAIDWQKIYPKDLPRRISAPTYPFAKKSYWPSPKPGLAAHSDLAPPERAETGALLERALQVLVRSISKILKLTSSEIHLESAWNDFGFDSVTFIQLAEHVKADFGIEINPALFFEYKTPNRFAAFLVEKYPEHLETGTRKPPRPVESRSPKMAPEPLRGSRFYSEQRYHEPIAIVGISGKFPGACDLDEFWDNLLEGKDCITEIPKDRWEWRDYFGDPKREANKTDVKWGGFLDTVADFDPLFFGISPREAPYIDPQARLLLTYAWKAIEDAGCSAQSLAGTKTGVFVGTGSTGYKDLFASLPIEGHAATGYLIPSIGPNRLSYFLDIHGPSEPIETTCSSSLVALHRAFSAIQDGSCDMAIAGGVNTIVIPEGYISYSKAGMLSLDGKCKAFAKDASGYVRGEGVGMVFLKRLQDAERDGNPIYGVIRGSAENHGGRANTLTSPNPAAQASVIVEAFRKAGVDPRTVTYIEAHGSGTELGDPIEINGLKAAFETLCPSQKDSTPWCGVASVKTNIGHLEVAAGISGVIKVLLQMKNRMLVKNLHSEILNPYIQLEATPFYIVQEKSEWRALSDSAGSKLPRRAGVSSFGMGGVNAHIVLEEYLPKQIVQDTLPDQAHAFLILLSAKNERRLNDQAAELLAALREKKYSDKELPSIAYTLQIGRDSMEERLAIAVYSLAELEEKLADFVEGKPGIDNLYQGSVGGGKEALAMMTADEDIELAIRSWFNKGKYNKLLGLWVKGFAIDWSKLYGNAKPPLISLPTYPFAKDRYWVPDQGNKSPSQKPTSQSQPERTYGFLQKRWVAAPPGASRREARAVMILVNSETRALAKALSEHFPRCCLLEAEELKQPASREDWKEWDGLIDLIGAGSREEFTGEWTSWLQHLVEKGPRNKMVILGVTRGIESYQNQKLNLAGASRVGLYRMLQSEYAHLRSRHMDGDPLSEDRLFVEEIVQEFFSESDEPEVCWRGGKRFVATLGRGSFDQATPGLRRERFKENELLLITGGTRGIGLLCANHFVENYGVKRLILIGREALPDKREWERFKNADSSIGKKVRAMQQLEHKGVEVNLLSQKLSDRKALQEQIESIRQLGSIAGAIHCAGIVDRETLAFIRKTPEKIQSVLEPKIAGTQVLYELLCKEPLKFFVLFSSVSAAVPYLSAGQADYAMANCYLDYFAEAHKKDLPIVSIQWPNWKESGMGEVTNRPYVESGICSITDKEGLSFLDQILANGSYSVILPAALNLELCKPERLMRHTDQEKSGKTMRERVEKPAATPREVEASGQSLKQVEQWLTLLFSEELKISPEGFKNDKPFQDYGVDSIILLQVLHRMNQQLSTQLDPSILYEFSTLQSLSKWLVKTQSKSLSNLIAIAEEELQEEAPSATAFPIAKDARALSEEVAVIGMSCRFPGAESLEGYWRLLSEGRSAIGLIPEDRWSEPSSFYAALLENATDFDCHYFQISEEDARGMDPQALLLLEESLKLWYQAGYQPADFKGKMVGVYIGGRSQHLPDESLLKAMRNPILGIGQNYLASNISQFFDLSGPSLVLDTACSSALVCMQMAFSALQRGEIEAAIVGGVGFLHSDRVHRLFEQRSILCPGPDFHLFDERASGIILGEGVGVVLLKRLSKALEDGDRIDAVIKGIAVNNDGKTAGPATPNFEAEKVVMQEALSRSGKKAEEIGYIEANGSGSLVTDLLELKAIHSVYHPHSQKPLKIGSIKPNIGHPLSAEGIASFIKVVLMLKAGQFPPFLSGKQPLAHFDREQAGISFSSTITPWDEPTRIAAINSFADGGTNVHLIIEGGSRSLPEGRQPLSPPELKKKSLRPKRVALSEMNFNIWDSCELEV